MEGIPSELAIVGGVGLALLAVLILVKWGKQILAILLVAVGAVIVVLIAWALLRHPGTLPEIDTSGASETISDLADIARVVAPKSEPEPVYQTPPPSGGGGFVAGLLTALVILSLVVGGYFYVRWKLAERQRKQPQARPLYRPEPRQRLPQLPPWTMGQQYPQAPPVVYYVTGDGQEVRIPDVDPSQWGW